MPKLSKNEVAEELAIDPDDEALIEHVFDDGEAPQGLHRQGWASCQIHGRFYSGFAKCPTCVAIEEDDNVDEYLYGDWRNE
jgi:hypothetical protein